MHTRQFTPPASFLPYSIAMTRIIEIPSDDDDIEKVEFKNSSRKGGRQVMTKVARPTESNRVQVSNSKKRKRIEDPPPQEEEPDIMPPDPGWAGDESGPRAKPRTVSVNIRMII